MSLKSTYEKQKPSEPQNSSSKSSTIIQEQMNLIKDQQDEITRLKSQIEKMKEQTEQQKSSEILRLQKEAERVPSLLQEISRLNEKIGTQSESDLIEKQNSELQKENKELNRLLTNAKKDAQHWEESGRSEYEAKEKALTEKAEAERSQRTAEAKEKHTALQRNRLIVALVVYFAFLAFLNLEPILSSLMLFIGQIRANIKLSVGIGVAVLLTIWFALYNQGELDKKAKKETYTKAVYAVNTALVIALGAVTAFYSYIPYLTYPLCLIVLIVAYQLVKMVVKSNHTV